MMKFNTILLLVFVLCSLLLVGCSKTVEEITASDDYLGDTVVVKGTAQSPIKIGTISGYTLVDENGDSIVVATKELPQEGEHVKAKGELKTGLFGFGFYIDEKP